MVLLEHLSIGSTINKNINLSETTRNAIFQITEKELTNTNLSNSVSNSMKQAMAKVFIDNMSRIQIMLAQRNSIVFNFTYPPPPGCPRPLPGGDFTLKNLTQSNDMVVNQLNKLDTSIVSTLQQELITAVKRKVQNISKSSADENIGTVFGDVGKDILGTIGDVAEDVATILEDASGGSDTTINLTSAKILENSKTIQSKYKLADVTQNDFNDIDTQYITQELNTKNVSNMLTEILQSNEIEYRGGCPFTNVNVDGVSQLNKMNAKIVSDVLNKTSNNIATKLVTNVDVYFNVLQEKSQNTTVGDVGSLGLAVAAALKMAGEQAVATIGATGNVLTALISSPAFIIGSILVTIIILVRIFYASRNQVILK